MWTLLPLLLLAVPLPAGEAVGSRGYVTAAEMARWPSGAEPIQAGVHLPRTQLSTGDPIPAYFFLHNRGDQPFALHVQLPMRPGGARHRSDIRVHLARNGKAVDFRQSRGLIALVANPPILAKDGYYCARCDLNQFGDAMLAAGDYELSWHDGSLLSNAVRFSVRGPTPHRTPSPALVNVFLRPLDLDDTTRPGEPLQRIPLADVALKLGTGVAGKYYPDPRDLPTRDDLLAVKAEWDRDRLRVTLTPHVGSAPVDVVDPQIYLQIEGVGADAGQVEEAQDGMRRGQRNPRAPRVFDVPLPKDWRRQVGLGSPARVAVVVASERLRPAGTGKLSQEVRRADTHAVRWTGVLRTPFVPIALPVLEKMP